MPIKSVEYLRELAEEFNDSAGVCCRWAADEIERLKAVISEVAVCGVEYESHKYYTVQIDPETWAELQKEVT